MDVHLRMRVEMGERERQDARPRPNAAPAPVSTQGNSSPHTRFRVGRRWWAMAEKGEKKHGKHVVPQKEKTGSARAETKEQSRRNVGASRKPWQMEGTTSNEVSVPAINHVGRTLESDPEFNNIPSSRPTPE